MSRVCDICGKHPMYGNRISKSYIHTRHVWNPNLVKVKTVIDGTPVTLRICTQCLRSGFITKKVRVPGTKVPTGKPQDTPQVQQQ